MSTFFNAFDISPVPQPTPDATPPEVFRGIYGMPMFITIPTPNLAASVDFWQRGLGFVDLFTIPNQLTHMRRWAFQDALLVPTAEQPAVPALTVSFACVLNEIDAIAATCAAIAPGCVTGPRETLWNTIDIEVTTPENARIIMTAAKPLDPNSQQARDFQAMGMTAAH